MKAKDGGPAFPPNTWKWFGLAGHFILGHQCQFHLCTQIGPVLVSTVGQYMPDAPVREILAETRGIVLEGRGDARYADYMNRIGFEEIGCGRKFETLVFAGGTPCMAKDCGCGQPSLKSGLEVDGIGTNDVRAATEAHMEMCKKWALDPHAMLAAREEDA